jgi:hypothetical protein
VNCLNVKKYILSIVSENFAVSVSLKLRDTKSKSRDLSRLVSIPYILYFTNFAIVFKLLLCLSPLISLASFNDLVVLVKCGRLGGISEMFLLPLRGLSVSGMYVKIKSF